MSRLDDLPPDQRATLSLLLRSRKSYADVAALLQIPERAVHDRAHAALTVLAPAQARALSAAQRAEIADYLLGQRTGVAERLATRTYLDGSQPAREWASALADELQPLAGGSLPEIPSGTSDAGGADEAPPSQPTPPGRALPPAPSSRRAGALLLAALVVIVAVVVVVVVDGSGGGSSSGSSTSAGSTASSTAAGTRSTTTGASEGKAKEDRRISLASPDPSSKAIAVAEVLSEGSQYAFYLAAEHLPPSKGFYYAVWLYNSPSSFEALSRVPTVGSSGNAQGGALLPKDAGKYHTMLVTRETQSRPTSPGPVVLRGAFGLH